VVEHLGVKLYQNRPTNALAELVSNGWDADADNVWVDLQLEGSSDNWWISVGDDGIGMDRDDVQREFLVIGRKRRTEATERTLKNRPLMGRKGIGKLAPFGISKLVDVFTVQEDRVTWISLNLKQMLTEGEDPSERAEYEPDVKFLGSLEEFSPSSQDCPIAQFLERLKGQTEEMDAQTVSGTLIILKKLTFSNPGWSQLFSARLVNRFVPALAESDFKVWVNDRLVRLEDNLPSYALRLPENEEWRREILPDGREIRWQALIVDLKRHKTTFGEDWTQERAGVAVYTHKKIAQDRPFFFGFKGRELYSRYLYGVVEAEWVDELSEDVISTDRASLNWEHSDLLELGTKGYQLVRDWLQEAEKHLRRRHDREIREEVEKRLEKVLPLYRERFSVSEVREMAATIMSLAPGSSLQKVVDITFSAVAHIPSWELLKELVQNVQEGELSEDVFGQIVFDLRFFENVNLAQVISRRLQAMKALEHLISIGAREVGPGEGDDTTTVATMHDLFRNNPWLLDLRWAAVADELPPQLTVDALSAAKTRLDRSYGQDICEFESWRRVGERAVDFFMLHVTEFENVVIVVEIKRANKSLSKRDLRQLQDYVDEVREELSEHSRSDLKVNGVLIGGRIGRGLRNHLRGTTYSAFEVMTWKTLLEEAKRSHQEFLRALAMGLHDDPRLERYLQDLGHVV